MLEKHHLIGLSFKQWQKFISKTNKDAAGKTLACLAQAGLTLQWRLSALSFRTPLKPGACKIRLFSQPELGCKGPKSISFARPVLKWKSTQPLPLSPEGGITTQDRQGPTEVHVFHKLLRMARTYSLHVSDTVLILKSSQNVLKAQI